MRLFGRTFQWNIKELSLKIELYLHDQSILDKLSKIIMIKMSYLRNSKLKQMDIFGIWNKLILTHYTCHQENESQT